MLTALITGAGSGLGREVARRLAGRGVAVALLGRRRAPLEETAAELAQALVVPADVREPDEVRAAIEGTLTRYGRLDVVVNCAALLAQGPQGVDAWTAFSCVLRTNVLGTALVTETAAPHLPQGGVVVTVGSSVADLPTPDALAYGASKAAVAHLTASLAARYKGRGIRVVGVAPGGLHEGGSLEATADAILFLLSKAGRFANGAMWRMDGGEVIGARLGPPRR